MVGWIGIGANVGMATMPGSDGSAGRGLPPWPINVGKIGTSIVGEAILVGVGVNGDSGIRTGTVGSAEIGCGDGSVGTTGAGFPIGPPPGVIPGLRVTRFVMLKLSACAFAQAS